MIPSSCDRLDDFLNRALSDEERAAFAAHLDACPECLQAVREQERMDQLLRQAVEQLQPVPAGLVERAERQIQRAARRRLLRYAVGLSAAAVLAGVATWWLSHSPRHEPPRPPERADITPAPEPSRPDPRSVVSVHFSPRSSVIAVPVKTESPNVTIIWVYPALTTAAAPELNSTDPSAAPERNGP